MHHLYELAESLGITVEYADLSWLDRDGDCNIDTKTIRLQSGMLHRLERSVLAHEIAHFIRGDRRSFFGWYDNRDERKADEWAAHFLINESEYRAAEARFGSNIEAIAQELNVMDYLVEAYENTLHRVGDIVYVNSKMGAGQWDKRISA